MLLTFMFSGNEFQPDEGRCFLSCGVSVRVGAGVTRGVRYEQTVTLVLAKVKCPDDARHRLLNWGRVDVLLAALREVLETLERLSRCL